LENIARKSQQVAIALAARPPAAVKRNLREIPPDQQCPRRNRETETRAVEFSNTFGSGKRRAQMNVVSRSVAKSWHEGEPDIGQ